jgi:hypothetical protein
VNDLRETFGLIGVPIRLLDAPREQEPLRAKETVWVATMDRSERNAAVSAYKERRAVAGVYAIRCAATDGQWVGAAPDLSGIWTRRSFALRQGIETNLALQSAWDAQGAESFAFRDDARSRFESLGAAGV